MVVAAGLVGVDRSRLHRARRLRLVVVGRRVDRAGELAEVAAHGRDHHVLDPELDRGVRRIDCPGTGRNADDAAFGVELGRHLGHLAFRYWGENAPLASTEPVKLVPNSTTGETVDASVTRSPGDSDLDVKLLFD